MKPSDLSGLVQVAGALYQREHAAIRDLIAEEGQLKAWLAQLDRQEAEASDQLAADPAMRLMGADILWGAWASRKRRDLNIELAQVIARKLDTMNKVRLAFGRKVATEELACRASARHRSRRSAHPE